MSDIVLVDKDELKAFLFVLKHKGIQFNREPPLRTIPAGDVLAVLKRVEWSKVEEVWHHDNLLDKYMICPICSMPENYEDHAPDCALNTLIKTLEGTV